MKARLLSLFLAISLLFDVGAIVRTPAEGAVMGSDFSEALVAYLKYAEGFSPTAFFDGTGWYIGYGIACDPENFPDGVTEETADAMLRFALDGIAEKVNSFLRQYTVVLTQSQFDALGAMTYNLGDSWLREENRLPLMISDGIGKYSDRDIATAIGVWCRVDGEISERLLHRRIAEAKMFLYGDYSGTYDGWHYLYMDVGEGDNQYDEIELFPAGLTYGELPNATRDGWYFAGWRNADGSELTGSDIVSGDRMVSAVWSETPPVSQVVIPANPDRPVATQTLDGEEEPEDRGLFYDVERPSWYAGYVDRLAAEGTISGYEDGSFRPYNGVTWGEALKMILLAAGLPAQAAKDGEHWASGYLSYAVRQGYVENGEVRNLDEAIHRDNIADLCAAALGLDDAPLTEATPFVDSNRDSALALYTAGILEGSILDGIRYFRGDDTITRAEICAVLSRVLDYVERNFVFVTKNQRAAINQEVSRNSYTASAFYTENGRLYAASPNPQAHYGIDVSYYQGQINWRAVANDGIEFVMIRCGYRGYGRNGSLNIDSQFRANIAGALAAGLKVGIYFFSQATSIGEALEEANYTLSLIHSYNITYPVVFDWEQITEAGSRTASPNWATVTNCTIAFCDTIAAAGYRPMTYFNKTMAYLNLDMSRLQQYDGWLAWYSTNMDYLYDFQMWQYSDSGTVSGISGRVDMNICFKNYG